jgi:2,5-dioxopentanoate dehydrogenase
MIAYQDAPQSILPQALKNENPLKIQRLVNGQRTVDPIA